MNAWEPVAALLVVFAVLDAAFSGFRASCGRTGLVQHAHHDRQGAKRGLLIGAALLAPIAGFILWSAANSQADLDSYLGAGQVMLWVFTPYGVLVLTAIAAYLTLDWRRRFLASVIILGPFTLIRPLVVLMALAGVILTTQDLRTATAAAAACVAILAVEPLCGYLWYRNSGLPRPHQGYETLT